MNQPSDDRLEAEVCEVGDVPRRPSRRCAGSQTSSASRSSTWRRASPRRLSWVLRTRDWTSAR
jgi:hypothetical protein